MWMFIFLVLPIVGMVYVMWHIWQILPFSNVWRWTAIGIAIATFLTMFASFTGILERVPLNVATIIYETGSSFIFILLYLVMTFLVLDALTLTRVIPREWLYSNGYTATAVTLFICALFVYGNLHYNDKFRQTLHISTTKDIAHSNTADKMRNDSTSNAKMKIVLLSDLHLG